MRYSHTDREEAQNVLKYSLDFLRVFIHCLLQSVSGIHRLPIISRNTLCRSSHPINHYSTTTSMDRYLMQAEIGKKIAPKTILLVRHGQSELNAAIYRQEGADENDVRYIDAPLTAEGQTQASNISAQVSKFKPELIVASPLTRAIQTAKLATSSLPDVPLTVTPLCSERLGCSCDIGTPISVMEKRFPDVDFSHIEDPESWWWTRIESDPSIKAGQKRSLELLKRPPQEASRDGIEPVDFYQKRVNDFRKWLLSREESRIVVFAHGVFLYNVVGETGEYFHNCEMRRIVL